MSEVSSKVKRAIAAYKGGQRAEARKLLMEVVDVDDKNEQGWLYLSLVVDSKQEQQLCLENVLAINPHNEQARKALEVLNKKLGIAPPPPPPSSISASRPSVPTKPMPAIEEESTIHSWGDIDTSSTNMDDGWGNLGGVAASPPPPPAAPTSSKSTPAAGDTGSGWFDDASPWNTNADDPAVSGGYTYGRTGADTQGTEFSHNELDSWISDMGIGQSESGALNLADLKRPPVPTPPPVASPPPQGGDLFAGIGGQSLPPVQGVSGWDDEPSASAPASLGEGWDEFATDAPAFDIKPTKADPFTDTKSALFASPASSSLKFGAVDERAKPELDSKQVFPAVPVTSFDLYADDDEDDGTPSYLSEDRDVTDVDGLRGLDAASAGYYRMIPDEIAAIEQKLPNAKVKAGPSVATIFVLLVLNLLALGGVVFNFMNMS